MLDFVGKCNFPRPIYRAICISIEPVKWKNFLRRRMYFITQPFQPEEIPTFLPYFVYEQCSLLLNPKWKTIVFYMTLYFHDTTCWQWQNLHLSLSKPSSGFWCDTALILFKWIIVTHCLSHYGYTWGCNSLFYVGFFSSFLFLLFYYFRTREGKISYVKNHFNQ